ncbi:hypothetical protein N9S22_03285 [Paracoccaceae bacterium]|nr:hypothetical protein [Paracoccaceae bacterium]
MRYILFCFLLILATQARSMDLKSFEEYDETSQDIYLLGLMNGLLFLQLAGKEFNNSDDLICPPRSVGFSPDLARAAIMNTKQKLDDPKGIVPLYVIYGLAEMFPCK